MIFEIKRLIKKLLFLIYRSEFREFNSFILDNNGILSDNAVRDLAKCCEAVELLKMKYRLTDGTILGIYRDGRLIPHDNDIDIDILVNNDINEKVIHDTFTSLGFRLGRKVYYQGRIQQLAYFNNKTHDIFDMIFWYPDRDQVVNYSERNFERTQDLRYFHESSEIQFQGRSYPVPAQLEQWLEMRYGEDWRVPKTYKSDWKEECFDMRQKSM